MILLAAAALAAEPPTDHVLGEPGFAFCSDPGRGGPEVLQWCPLLADAPADWCPGLRETCAKGTPPPPEPAGCTPPSDSAEKSDAIAGAPDAPEPDDPELTPPAWLDDLKSLLRWVMAFLVAGLVLVLLRAFVKSFGRPTPAPTPRPIAPAPDASADDELPAAPVPDVLAAARAALAAGRFDEVVALARGAALKHLAAQGRLALHRSRTDREYVRTARRAEPALGESLAAITRARESLLFGRRAIDASTAAAALAAAERIVAAALLLVLLAPTARAADPRYAPDGDAALPLLLQAWGHPVTWRLRSLDELDDETDVLVLDLEVIAPAPAQLEHLRSWVEGGGVAWLAGEPPDAFPELGPTAPSRCAPEVDPAWTQLSTPRRLPEGRVWAAPGGAPIVWCGDGAAAQALHLGDGVVIAFADDGWLRNAAFVDPATERFVGDLLHTGRIVDGWPTDDPARVELATRAALQSSSQGNNPFRSVANARLLPFVLQLLLTFAVLAAWRGWPFAPLRDPPEDGRRSFTEHVHALGTRLLRARASGVAARSMARYWHGRLGPAGLVLAAERAGRSPADAAAFARDVEARAQGPGRAGPADHAFMEELWTITRGRTP